MPVRTLRCFMCSGNSAANVKCKGWAANLAYLLGFRRLTPPRTRLRFICHLAHNEGNAMKSLLSIAVAVSLSLSAAVHAGNLVDVSVIDRDTGTILPAYTHDGKL